MTEIISKLTLADNKGAFLELIIEDILKDQNFANVRRQKSGSQYGYDVIGYKDSKCWKVECKNLNEEAKINDIAPKLIWHLENISIDRFVIVSVNGISNDLYHLLEKQLFSFPIEIWHGAFLVKIISESPNALNRLGLQKPDMAGMENEQPLIFPANELKFEVAYSRGLPFSFDYFFLGNEIIKAYSEIDFRLTATISNNTNKTFIIQEVIVRTLRFENTKNLRVLRQSKQKGLIEPIKLTFIPKKYAEGEVELNEELLIEVKKCSNEYIEFKLSQKCEPGYYEMIFEINCMDGNKTFSLYSPVFQLHKKSLANDLANLNVCGKYYDTPVDEILKLDTKTWQTLKHDYPDQLKYLGPTINDIIQENKIGNTWTVNLLKGKKVKTNGEFVLEIKPTRKSTLLTDLKIPIRETIHKKEDSIRRILNHMSWQ